MRCRDIVGAALSVVGLLSCGSTESAAPGTCAPSAARGTCAPLDAIAATSDYASSQLGAFALDGGASFASGIDLGADPALASSRGRAFYLARDLGDVIEVDPRCGRPLSKFSANDPSFAGSSNPQDVAVAPDGALWIPLYNVPEILLLTPSCTVSRKIDLSTFDPDGNPQANAITIVDGVGSPPSSKAFVALERLDDHDQLKSKQPSLMIEIDVASGAVQAQVELAGRNPFGLMQEIGGILYLAEPGNFDSITEQQAGIERFDTSTLTTQLLVPETALGGSVAEVAVTAGCGVAIVADASSVNATSLVSFDPDSGSVSRSATNPLLPTQGYFLQGLAWLGDVLLVGEGDPKYPKAAKVHVFDRTGTCELTERPGYVSMPLKPIALRSTT